LEGSVSAFFKFLKVDKGPLAAYSVGVELIHHVFRIPQLVYHIRKVRAFENLSLVGAMVSKGNKRAGEFGDFV
jgi:hypothetical protein